MIDEPSGQIEAIHIAAVKGGPARSVATAVVEANAGIVGDWRRRAGSRRQVTIIDGAMLERAGLRLGITVPPGASRRQITVRGLDLTATIGRRIQIGDVVLEVTTVCDPCEKMEVAIGRGGRDALGDDGCGVCARVIVGGTIASGDQLRLVAE